MEYAPIDKKSDMLKRPPIHIIEEVLTKKKEIRQSVPNSLYGILVNDKKIVYRGFKLKSDKIATFCDTLYKKHEKTKGNRVHILNSVVMQRKYGFRYKYIIDYLIKEGYIKKLLGYKPGVKSNSYIMLNKMFIDIPKVYINRDAVILKKYKSNVLCAILDKNELSEDILKGLSFNNIKSIPNYINREVGSKLVKDLYMITINKSESLSEASKIKNKLSKYYNMLRIKDISDKHIWYSFDSYGRFHSNFTVLKREIRDNYLTINGEEVHELDIKNSQPLLLTKIIKDSGEPGTLVNYAEFETFAELVKDGTLYQFFIDVCGYKDRRDVKKNLIYKVLFGDNINHKNRANRNFKKSFPSIFEFIKRFKNKNGNYKSLSHSLQRTESDLIFNKIIKDIMLEDININLFTVHDSICYAKSDSYIVEKIFNKHLKILKDSI